MRKAWVKLQRMLQGKRFLMLGIFFFIFLGYATAKEAWRRVRLEQDIQKLKTEIALLESENAQFQSTLEYFNSSLWEERELRQRLSLRREGETELILPQGERPQELKKVVLTGALERNPGPYLWWDYFFYHTP